MGDQQSQLDTSGGVRVPMAVYPGYANHAVPTDDIRWCGLTPFAQGYVEALAASVGEFIPRWNSHDERTELDRVRFSDLSPEALGMILADCERFVTGCDAGQGWRSAHYWLADWGLKPGSEGGRKYWGLRQGGGFAGRPPLTVSLNDDGKIVLAVKS